MSNLITPMLTSCENSPTVDFYPTSLRFSNSSCAIINASNDQICDTAELDDLEQLVGRSPYFKTSIPNKYSGVTCNRRTFNNNYYVSYDNSKVEDFKNLISDHSQSSLLPFNCFMDNSKVVNNLWNLSDSENNSCSKACININMGYNEGSSLESMVNLTNFTPKPVGHVEDTKLVESSVCPPITQNNNTQRQWSLSPTTVHDTYEDRNFKNSTKTGHSRQWGSCGSATALYLHFQDQEIKRKVSLVPKSSCVTVLPVTESTTTTTTSAITELRNTHSNQNNRQNRISQVSFEAEYDCEGRPHELIIVDFTKYDPFIMASQITQIELSYFRAIKSEEFLSFKWTGLSKNIHAPGIVASTRWFNQLTFWAQRVVLECSELNRRSEMLVYLIRIIKKLVDSFNNLSSGMALMSALEVECIHRLKQTWNSLSNKDRATFRRMEELFSNANNYEKLREHINSLKLPCIPYLGLYLTDLTYINVAHSKLSEFESQTKTDQINNILRTVSEFQQSEYDEVQCPILYRYLDSQRYIEELQKIIEENNYRSSLTLEPVIVDSANQDCPISPQKSPPSYACKHVPTRASLQSPISPQPVSPRSCDESGKEPSELSFDHQLAVRCDGDMLVSEDCTDSVTNKLDSAMTNDNADPGLMSIRALGYEDSLMTSSRYSDEDSVRGSLLCGAGRKSQFQKRTSIRFKRDSSSSSRQQVSSKTATLSSTSQSVVSGDKDAVGVHSKSLLDDSYLDSNLPEGTCSGPSSIDQLGQVLGLDDVLVVSNIVRQSEVLSTPPICRCIIKKNEVELIPKSSVTSKNEFANLVNIARAADRAVMFSARASDSEKGPGANSAPLLDDQGLDNNEDEEDDEDTIKLICQGVLARKACLKNAKRSRFSMWARYWAVLMQSRDNAYIAFFENCHFRALERKDFKCRKCQVQDLRKVTVTHLRPSLTMNICEQKGQTDASMDDSGHDYVKKFFLVDKEYGTVYKFRDLSARSRPLHRDRTASVTATATADQDSLSVSPSPSVATWYRLLKRSIAATTDILRSNDNKDLIVLADS